MSPCLILGDMASKEPKDVEEVLEKILGLTQEIKDKQAEIETLKARLSVKAQKPVPQGFEYKGAILAVFSASPNTEYKVDDVAHEIQKVHGFAPDRTTVGNRINYLVDRDPKLERVENKRGFFRFRKQETA